MMDNAGTTGQPFGVHQGLKAETLPLSVAGIQSLFSDIVSEIAVAKHGLLDRAIELPAFVAYAERRMPAVFAMEAVTRDSGVDAIQNAVERVEKADLPEGGFVWPLNPQWLSDIVNQVVTPLITAWARLNIHVPGATDLLRWFEFSELPKVMGTIDEDGEHHARTEFIAVGDSAREAQYVIHRRDGILHFARRFRGSKEFEPLSEIPSEAATALLALLHWYHGNPQSPRLANRHSNQTIRRVRTGGDQSPNRYPKRVLNSRPPLHANTESHEAPHLKCRIGPVAAGHQKSPQVRFSPPLRETQHQQPHGREPVWVRMPRCGQPRSTAWRLRVAAWNPCGSMGDIFPYKRRRAQFGQ